MAESYFPFDAGPGSAILEQSWQKMARRWLSSGAISGYLNGLAVTADGTSLAVTLATGGAWVEGFYYENDAAKSLAIGTANATNPRIDTVVLRLDRTANTCLAVVVAGTPAASPVAPTLNATDTLYDLPLANVTVPAAAGVIAAGNVTDRRAFAGPTGLTAGRAGATPLTVKAAASQTADLQKWQNSAGTDVASIDAAGKVTGLNGSYFRTTAAQTVAVFAEADSGGRIPLVAKGATSQTASLQEWQTTSGTVAAVSSAGVLSAAGVASTTPVKSVNGLASTGGTTSPGITLADQTDASTAPHTSEVVVGQITQRLHFDTTDTSRIAWKHVFARDGYTASQIAFEMNDEVGGRYVRAIFGNKANTICLTVRGNPSQSGDLQQWQNSAGTAVAYVSSTGRVGLTTSTAGFREVDCGPVDSGGTGFRVLRVIN